MSFFRPLQRRDEYEKRESGEYFEYSYYRTSIAEDCLLSCVYCDSHEDSIGGREATVLDHFRPWNRPFGPNKERKFGELKNVPSNLVHSCRVCNGYKWSHWPTEDPERPYDNEKGWIEPFEEVRSEFFEVREDGTVVPIKVPAKYQIETLRLNRPLLKRQREFRVLMNVFESVVKPRWEAVVASEPGTAHAQTAAEAIELLKLIQSIARS